jgi:hypothetical protein
MTASSAFPSAEGGDEGDGGGPAAGQVANSA